VSSEVEISGEANLPFVSKSLTRYRHFGFGVENSIDPPSMRSYRFVNAGTVNPIVGNSPLDQAHRTR